MEKELNDLLIAKITETIPNHIKPVDYLMEVLELGKDSIYRRLKGEVVFTFEEVVAISRSMGFSLDEIAGRTKSSQVLFTNYYPVSAHPGEAVRVGLERFLSYLSGRENPQAGKVLIAINHFPLEFIIGFDHLFRFHYYKWTFQSGEIPSGRLLEEVAVPGDVQALCDAIRSRGPSLGRQTLILDRLIYRNLLREILYYHKRGLVSAGELSLIREDCLSHIAYLERMAQTGEGFFSTDYQLYLSTLDIESTCVYERYGGKEGSFLELHPWAPVITEDPSACRLNMRWIESLKKYSTLITRSNELDQTAFFDEQRKLVNTTDHDTYPQSY